MLKKISVFLILISAFFLRTLNINSLLAFHYDQGRDALVIWDLLYKGKMFLIGPTTGLAGVFRGPFYYYLIAPFYFLGKGNPIYPTMFLIFTAVLAIWLMYFLVLKSQDKQSGLIAIILASFSYFMVWTSRWLSNPTPMLLLSMILVWAMYLVLKGKQYGWYVIALVTGLSLFSFGSSGEFFYIPAILIFLTLNWKNRPNLKTFLISLILFIFTFSPLLIFDIKHDGILRNGIVNNFVEEKSFVLPTKSLLENRTRFYYESFSTKIFHSREKTEMVLLTILLISFIYLLPSLYKNKFSRIILILLISPLLGLYFYQGNNNNFYEYYLTCYYMIYIMLTSLVLGKLWQKNYLGKIFVIIFMLVFLRNNYYPLNTKLLDKSDSPNSIAFINQLEAVNYLAYDSTGNKFNVDVYVPPVISYSYDYLFKWKGVIQEENQVKLLYTLYEEDPPHPERLKAWLDRQKGIGKVIEETKFGAITVQKRERI
ncbi:MAG: glycosyltransferase family 39 protein [Candidatus Woesebacteria bacterium]|nr:glycosyltransferase family 39 protein [Candidatus Woesebacteria bacterium]